MSFTLIGTPTVFANDATDGGTAWTNVNGAADTTGNGASCSLAAGTESQWLVCTGCDFQVMPAGAVLVGTELTFQVSASLLGLIQIMGANSVIGGVVGLVNGLVTPVLGLLGFTNGSAGGPTTVIGAQNSAEVRANGYGMAVRAQNTGILPATANVRDVRVVISYDVPIIQNLFGGTVVG